MNWQPIGSEPRRRGFSISSRLDAPAERVWAHATTMTGVNAELWPLLRMTYPPTREHLDTSVVLGQRLFRSYLLLFGVLPVEYDDLTLAAIGPGFRFREHSALLTQREWIHERTVMALDRGCELTDQIQFTPRIAALGPAQGATFRLVFRWRHRNLRRLFGAAGG